MKPVIEFIKVTLVGGILIILPVYVSVLLLLKAFNGLLSLVKPISDHIPAAVDHPQAAAIAVLVILCFVAGLITRTRIGLRAKDVVEEAVLAKLPGYGLLRSLTGRVTGQVNEAAFAPALVEIEEALVPALIIEELPDGSFTVLVPSVPTPMAGALYILPKERVHRVDVSFATALKVFTKWGTGAGEFVQAMRVPIKPKETLAQM